MLVVSVGVNSLLVTPKRFDHAVWAGVHPLDLVFPVFVALTGCGLAVAMHRRVRFWPLARRVAILIAVGLVYNAIVLDSIDPAAWVLTGVLQLYAGAVAVLGLLHLVTRVWRGWLIVAVVSAGAYFTLLALWANGCPDRALVPGCNPSATIDVAGFGAVHTYHQGQWGHDPVGLAALAGALVTAAGALVTASAGATVGHLLVRRRRPFTPAASIVPLVSAAGVFALLAPAAVLVSLWLGAAEPLVMKELWASRRFCIVSGCTCGREGSPGPLLPIVTVNPRRCAAASRRAGPARWGSRRSRRRGASGERLRRSRA